MVTVIDYGVGNLFSLTSSLKAIGEDVIVTGNADKILESERLILPGVGAFGDAAAQLEKTGLRDIIREKASDGTPLLGICLGMQLLLEKSLEYGEHNGLALIPGKVIPISNVINPSLKIPHIGWNALHFTDIKHPLFKYTEENKCVYFVHSFYASECEKFTVATTEYSAELTAAVADGNITGCQFHPEKSGKTGLKILKAFCEM